MRVSGLCLLGILCAALPLEAQRNCVKGKPCGNTCIARDRVCRIGTPSLAKPDSAAAVVAVPRGTVTPWVAAKGARIFYRNAPGCEVVKTLAPHDLVYFTDEKAALRGGYRRSKEDGC